ncbi:MAG: hypothetical protein KKC03_13245 [Bacteroidetes bacterium]|nr:hypothetical protein [Bacteroidota bacterium]
MGRKKKPAPKIGQITAYIQILESLIPDLQVLPSSAVVTCIDTPENDYEGYYKSTFEGMRKIEQQHSPLTLLVDNANDEAPQVIGIFGPGEYGESNARAMLAAGKMLSEAMSLAQFARDRIRWWQTNIKDLLDEYEETGTLDPAEIRDTLKGIITDMEAIG